MGTGIDAAGDGSTILADKDSQPGYQSPTGSPSGKDGGGNFDSDNDSAAPSVDSSSSTESAHRRDSSSGGSPEPCAEDAGSEKKGSGPAGHGNGRVHTALTTAKVSWNSSRPWHSESPVIWLSRSY